MGQITHNEHQSDYDAGYNAAIEDINTFGIEAAKYKWRMENPLGTNPSSLSAYYYSKAGLDALVESPH